MRKKYLAIALAITLVFATIVFAQAITKYYYGISTPYIYPMTASTQAVSSYYLALPTLSANDTFVGLTTTQTLTNKTLTSPTITSPTITGTTSIGSGATLTTPIVNFGAGSHSYSGGTTAYTLAGAELGYIYFKLTSAGGGVDLVAPNSAGHVIMVWNSTGQTLTVKKSAGTGTTVASTKKAVLIHNGTDYVNALGDQ